MSPTQFFQLCAVSPIYKSRYNFTCSGGGIGNHLLILRIMNADINK